MNKAATLAHYTAQVEQVLRDDLAAAARMLALANWMAGHCIACQSEHEHAEGCELARIVRLYFVAPSPDGCGRRRG